MLKKSYSYNGNISKIPSYRLNRTGSNVTLSLTDLLDTEICYNNPGLLKGYIPIVNEVSKSEMERANDQILSSLNNDRWFFDLPRRNPVETEQERKERGRLEAWHDRCISTKDNLEYMKSHLEFMINGKNYFHFICYMGNQPIGLIMLKYASDEKLCYPEVLYIITHTGIQNCAYLLMEKAVNKSYQMGALGNLKVNVADDFLKINVYAKLGFISVGKDEMQLCPFTARQQWVFYHYRGEFRFLGNC
ncbi:N-acetyltransferase [Xenorhabdus beddingii]|uniref:N-acetyltransferase n=1 Tax=Xenorhabdus beddingii TaxID=40578 RepID=A0A1Y2SUD2_9GAMM|nr:GNAT family N-acetyltransferase [Xenorhabdus beddingii]OTA21574.1 N-acetyltransferase [Xenorhabdus beddingii]